MANRADPDQLASWEANWSGSTLFAKAGCIRVQQDKGYYRKKKLSHEFKDVPIILNMENDLAVIYTLLQQSESFPEGHY